MYTTFQSDRFNIFASQALYLSIPRHTRKVKCFHRETFKKYKCNEKNLNWDHHITGHKKGRDLNNPGR